ncbi:HDOD domain-containing protein, partial [Salmonella enterica subsp. enterica serovar Typhimurium]|nr:HDOD domain-containing protein [Salmonella enterica subsp. enterica serovar Typhimurium]
AADAASAASLKGITGVNLPQFWAYSLNVAKLSRSLAGVTRQNQGAAFTCGLIHAIGELVMHAGMPAEMAALNKELGP